MLVKGLITRTDGTAGSQPCTSKKKTTKNSHITISAQDGTDKIVIAQSLFFLLHGLFTKEVEPQYDPHFRIGGCSIVKSEIHYEAASTLNGALRKRLSGAWPS